MKTRAAISKPGEKFPIIEAIDLGEPRAGEILVRIVATGVCHTDMFVHGLTSAPTVLGHEGAGIVEQVGEGVRTLVPGDHVVLSYGYCGQCPSCHSGAHSYCYELMPLNGGGLREDGTSAVSQAGRPVRAGFFCQSSFSPYAIARADAAVKVPKDMPLEIVGPLGCGVLTGAGAVINAFKVRPGQSIAVFGAGGVGLSAVMAAKLAGASRIIAIDKIPARLTLARELGATDVFDVASGDVAAAIRALLPNGVDFSLNTTTSPQIFLAATACLAARGTTGVVVTPEGDISPAMLGFLSGGQRWRAIALGDATPATFIPMLIDYYKQGRFPFDRLIKFYAFDEIALAFADAESGKTVKPVLRMPH